MFVVGAHSTGKTTLCHELCSRRRGWSTAEELATKVLREMDESLEDIRGDLYGVTQFQYDMFEKSSRRDLGPLGCVKLYDRSFDNVAYMIQHGRPDKAFPGIVLKHLDKVRRMVHKGSAIVIFVRPTPECVGGGNSEREESGWDEICRIDGVIKALLFFGRIPYVSLGMVSLQERVAAVEAIVDAIV